MKKVVVTQYDYTNGEYGEVVEQEYNEVFEVDRNDESFITIVHDDDGETVEEMIRRSDIIHAEVRHGEDLITPAREAREEYRRALAEQERQARVQASGLSLA